MSQESFQLGGVFTWEVFEDGRLVDRQQVKNGITTEGINDLFEQYFLAGTGVTPVIGLIDATSYSSVTAGDTMASHSGWVELEAYDEATRPAWSPDTPSSANINNSVKVEFTINAASSVRGLFISTDDTKGGTAGKLWSTAILSLVSSVQSGQVARAGYSLSGVGA